MAVGDIDVDRTEAKIKEYFGAIPAKENPLPKPVQTIADHSEPRVGIITDPETTSPSVEVIWHSAAMPEIANATLIGQANDLVKTLVSMVMRERFQDITSKPGSAFLDGSLYISSLIYEDIDAVMGEVSLKEDNILGGFKAYYTELARLQRYGITEAEFNRAKADYLSMLETRVNRAPTRQNPEFVRPILSNFFDKKPVLEPEDQLEIAQTLFTQLNAAAISQAAAGLFTPQNLVVVYTGPEKNGIDTPAAEQLLQVMAEVNASEIAAPEGEDIPEAFLDPAKLKGSKVKKTANTLYMATEWTLGNGVKVIVYPTDLAKDQILFNLVKEGGKSLIPNEDIASFDGNIFGLFQQNSGVSSFSGTTVTKMLTGKNLSVNPYFDTVEHGINGRSTVKDFETALQLVYLYFTDPRFDAEEWQNGIDQLEAVLPNLVNQPNYKLQKEYYKTLYDNNPRKQALSQELLDQASLQKVEKNWRKLFADAAGATFFIVGDVNPEAVKPLVEKYIGSLPKGKKALSWTDPHEDLVKGVIDNVFTVDMQTPKSTVLQVYSADIPFSYDTDAALDVISYILDMRYVESLREEEGGTYGASTAAMLIRRPKEQALIQVYFDCRPSVCDKLRQLAKDGLQDMAKNGPTDEELNMAKLNLQKNLPESRQRNNYWLNRLENFVTFRQDGDYLREIAINNVSKESVQQLLKDILYQGNFTELVMKPENTAEAE